MRLWAALGRPQDRAGRLLRQAERQAERLRHARAMHVFGRDRRRIAAQVASLRPEHDLVEADDATSSVVSANLLRRDMTKGQKAMAYAMIYPDPARGGVPRAGTVAVPEVLSKQRISYARTVLAEAPKLAQAVLGGAMLLDEAYQEALLIKQETTAALSRVGLLR